MPRGHRQSRRDANHTEIVNYARGIGFTVLEVHSIGGALDLVIGAWGIDCRVEVKNGLKPPSARMLTDAENKTFSHWKGRKPIIWLCESDVDRTMQEFYQEAIRWKQRS